MDRFQSMNVFVCVAQKSSFAAAARELRLSPAAVSKIVSTLTNAFGDGRRDPWWPTGA